MRLKFTIKSTVIPSVSLHTESEILIRNFHTLKNQCNLMLCQSCLHTASKIFVHKNKIESGSIFCFFVSVAFWKDGQYKKTDKTHAIISDSVCNYLYSFLRRKTEIVFSHKSTLVFQKLNKLFSAVCIGYDDRWLESQASSSGNSSVRQTQPECDWEATALDDSRGNPESTWLYQSLGGKRRSADRLHRQQCSCKPISPFLV